MNHVEDARQLERLRQWREQRRHEERAQAEREREAAQAAVHRREAELAGHREARSGLLQRAVQHDAAQLARLAPYLSASREDLDDKLERAEYALIDDEEALGEAVQALDAARARWLAAHARHQAASDLLARARLEHRHAAERRAEREDAPTARASTLNLKRPDGASPR
jgi:hypothetical protein